MAWNETPNDARGGIEPYSPFVTEERPAGSGRPLSLRLYGLTLSALVFAGFAVMGFCASLFGNVEFLLAVSKSFRLLTILSFVGAFAGIFMMSAAKKSQSVGLSLAGYAVFILAFGFMTSTVLLSYTAQTISTAFLATAGIVAVFACLGIAFPHFFERIQGVLFAALLGLIIVQVVMMFIGANQTIIDFAVIVVFCGFIGYDFHHAMEDEPTLVNAVFNASNLFLDIINVFVRVLSIFGRNN